MNDVPCHSGDFSPDAWVPRCCKHCFEIPIGQDGKNRFVQASSAGLYIKPVTFSRR